VSATQALDGLVEVLARELERAPDAARIADLLREYAETHRDWRHFLFLDEESYTRNLVTRRERFELLLLGWGPGQETPIHGHEGQDCWMTVLEGEVEEVRYPCPHEVGPGPLRPRDSRVFRPGEVAYISDDVGLHVVRSASGETPGVSLHLYAAPYDGCDVYCPDTGKVSRKQLLNYSERGRLCAQEAT
jgi:cysteine dioxygenase